MYCTAIESLTLPNVLRYMLPLYRGKSGQWKTVGQNLGLSNEQLSNIESEFPDTDKHLLARMLDKWLKSDPSATWDKVNDAKTTLTAEPGTHYKSIATS